MDFKARLKQAGYSEEEVSKIENSCKIATMLVDEYGISIEDMLDKTAEFHDVAIEKTAGMTIDESEEFSKMANAGIESELAAAIILSVKTASAIVRVVNAEAEGKMTIEKLATIIKNDAIENSEVRIKMSSAGYTKEEIEKHIRGQL